MAEALTIDGQPVPVLENTWKETIFVPGSRARTETGNLRSVRLGCPVSTFVGQSFFALRVDADLLRDRLLTYGDHTIGGELPGRTVTCETDCGPVEAIDHRPYGVDPTAQWRLAFTLTETDCVEEDTVVAGIGLIVSIVGQVGSNRVEAALIAAGHTVTQIDHDAFRTGEIPYTPYEILVLHRISYSAAMGSKVREVINSGRGVVSMADAQTDGIIIPLLTRVGLHAGDSFLWQLGIGKTVAVTDGSHDITAGYGSYEVEVLGGNGKTQVLNGPVEGVILAVGDPYNVDLADEAAIVAYEVGTAYLTAPYDPIPARVVFLGWSPDVQALTAASTLFLQRAVQWVLGG